MANRNRMPPQMGGGGGRPGPQGPILRGPGPNHFGPPPPMGPQTLVVSGPLLNPGQVEQKLQHQQSEIHRLLTENQRLAAIHVALRQELAAAQGELQRFQQTMGVLQSENRSLVEKAAKMEQEIRATEPMKLDLHQLRMELQSVAARRNEVDQARGALTQQVQQLQQDKLMMHNDLQKLGPLQAELDGLRQEFQRARSALDYERKANAEQHEQKQAMEANLVSMAREVEKLKAQLTNVQRGAPNSTPYAASGYAISETAYPNGPPPQQLYGNGYAVQGGMGVGQDPGLTYGGVANHWGQPIPYDGARGPSNVRGRSKRRLAS